MTIMASLHLRETEFLIFVRKHELTGKDFFTIKVQGINGFTMTGEISLFLEKDQLIEFAGILNSEISNALNESR